MNNPWDLKKDDKRIEDLKPNFIIFCEDEVSEPTYFKSFETDLINIVTIKNQKSKIKNVFNAIKYCQKNDLMEFKDGKYFLNKENNQVWCVFDRDIETNDLEKDNENISFDKSIETAINQGFKLAWSNDAFELWILLHFQEIDLLDYNYKIRQTYYNKLSEIFKNQINKNEELLKIINHESFSYKKDFKQLKKFKNIILPQILEKTNIAIKNAEKLEQYFEKQDIPNHQKSPLTLVHHLVIELLNLGC